jgi:uncharacterized protein YeaO (DUF488 family)
MIRIKRVYDAPARADGTRILIDRVWPRGLTKKDVAADEWLKDVAPSTALRRWFGHDPAKWPEFRRRYAAELAKQPVAVAHLRALARRGTVTLVFGARDAEHSNAAALKAYLERRK